MPRRFEAPPACIVDGGVQRLGTFDGPLVNVNLVDAPWTPPLPRSMRTLRLKEWQAVQLVNERWFAIVALFDAKLIALVQTKLYDRQTGRKYVFERKVLTGAFENTRQVLFSDSAYRRSGVTVAFANRLQEGYLDVELDLPEEGDRPRIAGRVRATLEPGALHVGSWPFGRGRGAVSHKGMFRAEGTLRVGEEDVRFEAPTGVAFLDHHKGTYPYEMRWDWVTTGGFDGRRRIGLNLTRNDSTDPVQYNENVLWLDGRPHLLPPVTFEREAGDPEVWSVRDSVGRIDVRFIVEVDGRVDVNALVVRSKYRGPFGRFEGTVTTAEGEEVSLDGLFGMGEKFYLRC